MDETRASAKAIAVGSLIAFFGGCIAACIMASVIFGASIIPVFQQLENLDDKARSEVAAAEVEKAFSNPATGILFIAVFGGFALLGGYTAGRMGKEDPPLNGTWVGGVVGGIFLLSTPSPAPAHFGGGRSVKSVSQPLHRTRASSGYILLGDAGRTARKERRRIRNIAGRKEET